MKKILIGLLVFSGLVFGKNLIDTKNMDMDSAEYTVAHYINALGNNNYSIMVRYAQTRWVEREKDPILAIKNIYGSSKIFTAKISNIKNKSENYKVVTVKISYIDLREKRLDGIIKVNVIKEGLYFGVNPISGYIK